MKKVVFALIIGLVLIAGIAVKLGQNNDKTKNPSSPTGTTEQSGTTNSAKGSYVDYSSDIIAKTSGTKILFFYAPWCPQCRALEADIKAKGVPSGVTIIKVDYDSNQKLRQKYGVTIQTTLVKVDDNGNLVKKYVAYDEPNLEAVKKNLL